MPADIGTARRGSADFRVVLRVERRVSVSERVETGVTVRAVVRDWIARRAGGRSGDVRRVCR